MIYPIRFGFIASAAILARSAQPHIEISATERAQNIDGLVRQTLDDMLDHVIATGFRGFADRFYQRITELANDINVDKIGTIELLESMIRDESMFNEHTIRRGHILYFLGRYKTHLILGQRFAQMLQGMVNNDGRLEYMTSLCEQLTEISGDINMSKLDIIKKFESDLHDSGYRIDDKTAGGGLLTFLKNCREEREKLIDASPVGERPAKVHSFLNGCGQVEYDPAIELAVEELILDEPFQIVGVCEMMKKWRDVIKARTNVNLEQILQRFTDEFKKREDNQDYTTEYRQAAKLLCCTSRAMLNEMN